jgi:hypothetical protein
MLLAVAGFLARTDITDEEDAGDRKVAREFRLKGKW